MLKKFPQNFLYKSLQKDRKSFLETFFKKLLLQNKTYLIGSSYTQAIFPLIPYKVNIFNIKYGKQIYKKIINQVPKIAYVNEQCFSKSVVDLYKNQKYQTLIMDWDCVKNNKNINQKHKTQKAHCYLTVRVTRKRKYRCLQLK